MIKLDSTINRSKDWLTSEIDDEIVMMSVENGKYYALSKIGVSIWNCIQSSTKVADICSNLMEKYNVDSSVCQEETLTFLNTLLEEKIIIVES